MADMSPQDFTPSADDLMSRMQALAPPRGAAPSDSIPTMTVRPSDSAPSVDDLVARMNTIAPPAATAGTAKGAPDGVDPITGYPVDDTGKPVAGAGTTLAGKDQGTLIPGGAEPFKRIGSAAADEYSNTPNPLMTPAFQRQIEQAGPVGNYLTSPLLQAGGAVLRGGAALGAGMTQAVNEGATAAGAPTLARDINPFLTVAGIAMGGAPGAPLTKAGLVSREMAVPENALAAAAERHSDRLAAPLPDAFRDNPVAARNTTGAAGADITTEPIPEPTPAQKATALQKMVNQSATDRLTPQGRDDATYFPGVERPEAMRDFTPAAEGEMSASLQHKALYNTDTNYHDQFDAQVKKNNDIMLNGTTIKDANGNPVRVDGLHDMFGDANGREAAMEDARQLMPGSVNLFDGEKPVDVQPVGDLIKTILSSSKGKIDGVANSLNKILPKLQDAEGNPETMPSMIKGIFDDVNNKLFDKSPTNEGNEARQARDQLLQVKAALSKVIGEGLPGTKWTDYLSNLSGALGQVDKLDYMQQFLTGTKKLTNGSGDLQLTKVDNMLEDIRKRSADPTGGARHMTMDDINKIESVRNELAAKKLLDDRAAVRGSPTVQLGNAAGILGSGPLGAAVKGAAEVGMHMGLAATTGGVGNAALGGYRYIIKPAMEAAKTQKAVNALAATKNRLLDTTPNPLGAP